MTVSRLEEGGALFVPRSGVSWQTMLADLALILFMVTAAAMADAPTKPKEPSAPPPAAAPEPPVQSEPLAVWRFAPDGPALGPWIASQQPDPRQQLTITLRYNPGQQAAALAQGSALAASAREFGGPTGARARIILEPSAQEERLEAVAALAFDQNAGATPP
ncbi:hypothetical protein [Novosphingobium umbonatum]|nr:hypothetical protein [Novosphingobium umbonatum]